MSLKIVFMGTPNFSVSALDALLKNKFNLACVYTQPPKKSKRGQKVNFSPVEEFCKKNQLLIKNPINLNNHNEFEIFKKLSPDIVIVVAYGKLIPKNFLNIPKFGFINIHASLLPRWRGAAPIQRAIINGDKTTGISIMKIEEKLDSGPVLVTKKLELNNTDTHGLVEKKLSTIGANLLIESLKIIGSGKAKFLDQDKSQATYAKKIEKNETKINWNLNADKVLGHIHGLSPYPGAWFQYKGERFKVLKAKISSKIGKAGFVLDENLTVGCNTNSIQILELQRQGKNKQTMKEFLLGNKINKDTNLI